MACANATGSNVSVALGLGVTVSVGCLGDVADGSNVSVTATVSDGDTGAITVAVSVKVGVSVTVLVALGSDARKTAVPVAAESAAPRLSAGINTPAAISASRMPAPSHTSGRRNSGTFLGGSVSVLKVSCGITTGGPSRAAGKGDNAGVSGMGEGVNARRGMLTGRVKNSVLSLSTPLTACSKACAKAVTLGKRSAADFASVLSSTSLAAGGRSARHVWGGVGSSLRCLFIRT